MVSYVYNNPNPNPIYIRLDKTPECDRMTEIQTDRYPPTTACPN